MTYVAGGKIQAPDYNSFATAVNNVWATGTGNSGYGQTALGTVSVGNKVFSTNWSSLVNTIATSALHQGTSISAIVGPSAGNKIIAFVPTLQNNITSITNSRLNAATQNGTATTVATNNISTWADSLTYTFSVTFASNNAARYFFNSGGQIGFNFAHPSGPGLNPLITEICSDTGTVWLSSPTSGTVSLSGINYNGVTKSGGANPGGTTINSNGGFYALTSTSTQIFNQTGVPSYPYTIYGSTFLRISAAYNGSGVLSFTCLFDEVPNGALISTGTSATLTVRSPSSAYISDTWGVPVVGFTVTPV